jgi:hypothetical protein
MNPCDFAYELSSVLVNHHEVVHSRNEKTMGGGIRYDVIPAPVSAEKRSTRNVVRGLVLS